MMAYHEVQGNIANCPPKPIYHRIVETWSELSSSLASLEQSG